MEVWKLPSMSILSWWWPRKLDAKKRSLGDSGFVQLRPNTVYYSSDPQIHAFNTPFQLSLIPPRILARSRAFGGTHFQDYPEDANVTYHNVKHGDVLVFATDGVWDNLSPANVLRIVSERMISFRGWVADERGLEASEYLELLTQEGGVATLERTMQAMLAGAIAGEAKMASMNTKVDGPFAREVQKYYPGESWHGGKVDDICVVVAVIVRKTT